ncbi:sigma-70 family RNA polymerase sigma factor [Colwellia sp. MSW7]|uniref:Sigma-70 family RNA polymerase sigma factor n=1 Tax=Colwellia maritima TaxID=2912588 RepID=A0ABS9X2J9_9GAMM|nr:sigma-70 family RNA polymerase sigma factor [Colwellia maritima]MCI2284409.1 sigma-70 family RNA polymerase sigma factor [Colwellia maritima]
MKKQTSPPQDLENEKQLIDGLLNNDNCAYETLVRQYSSRMYAIARRFFNNDDDAQECLQKAFIQVFKNIISFNKDASLATWLHRITVNEALMMIRKRKRQQTTSLDDFTQHYNEFGERTVFSDSETDELGQSLGNTIEAIFEQKETKLSLTEIIYQLPEKYCNVLLLRDIQEMNTKETAALLFISEASVKTQLHRARLLLKAILEQQDKENLENNWKVN